MRTIGNRDWQWPPLTNPVNILDWNHFCTSYSVDKRHMKMVHNGNLEVDHVRPKEVASLEDYVPSQWFGPNLDGTKTKDKTNASFVPSENDLMCLILEGTHSDEEAVGEQLRHGELHRLQRVGPGAERGRDGGVHEVREPDAGEPHPMEQLGLDVHTGHRS